MAPSRFRPFHFLRSIAVPVCAVSGFCGLLTVFFVLYQPVLGPEHKQKVGWQSWSIIDQNAQAIVPPTGNISSTPAHPDNGVDWWNVTDPTAQTLDSANFPLDVWNPLLPHDTGLSEISVEKCFVAPWLAVGNVCGPKTTPEQDSIKGKWVRVEGNLNVESGLYYLHMYYRRTRRLDIPLVTELVILGEGEEPTDNSAHWHKIPRSLRDGVLRAPPIYLWYKIEKTMSQLSADEKQNKLVTEMDVLYGEDRPWYGFTKLEPATTLEQEGKVDSVFATYRTGVRPAPKAPPLHFTRDGKFKIMQVADLHYSVSRGVCKDTILDPCTHSDNLTTTLIGHMIAVEKPDLIVFSGDQLNGQHTSWDPRSVLAKFSAAAADAGVPWAAVFGNHDDEDGMGRAEQMRQMQALPYALVQPGPADVHGVGNYVLKVLSADASRTHLLTLYFLDSGAYAKGYWSWFGFEGTEYDWIHQNQIDWFLQESAAINAIERPFTPDGSKDLGDIWHRQGGDQLTPQSSRLAKPNALVFFHIPLPQTYNKADLDPDTGKPLDIGSVYDENDSPKKDDGFFEKGLLQALESEHRAGGGIREVKVVANGHSHVNDNCRRIKGLWLCFGGGSSYSGYSRIGFDRRVRVYDISDYGETIRTYKRTEKDEIVDEMVLSGRGAPAP